MDRFAYPLEAGKSFTNRFTTSEIPLRASALAYHTLLAIVPVIGLVFLYLKKIGITRKWHQRVQEFILAHLNVGASEDFMKYFSKLTSTVSGNSWGYVGLGVFIYTGYSLIMRLGNSLDFILNTSLAAPEFKKDFLKLTLRRLFVLIILPVALMVSLFVTSWLKNESILREIFKLETVGPWLATPLPILIDGVAFFFVYHFIPQRPLRALETLKTAFLVSIVFELARMGVGTYNKHALMTHKLYGALAVIPVFIIWVQAAWMIILTGALFIRIPKDQPQRYITREQRRSELDRRIPKDKED